MYVFIAQCTPFRISTMPTWPGNRISDALECPGTIPEKTVDIKHHRHCSHRPMTTHQRWRRQRPRRPPTCTARSTLCLSSRRRRRPRRSTSSACPSSVRRRPPTARWRCPASRAPPRRRLSVLPAHPLRRAAPSRRRGPGSSRPSWRRVRRRAVVLSVRCSELYGPPVLSAVSGPSAGGRRPRCQLSRPAARDESPSRLVGNYRRWRQLDGPTDAVNVRRIGADGLRRAAGVGMGTACIEKRCTPTQA